MKSYFKLMIILVVLAFDIVTIPDSSALPVVNLHENEKKTSRVEIRVISRKKRTIDSKPYGFDLELNAFSETHRLQLRSPSHSAFTETFDYHELGIGANGELINKQKRINKRELEEVEQNMFVDHRASAAIKIVERAGQLHLDGLIGRNRIRRDATTGEHVGIKIKTENDNDNSTERDDYVDNHRPVATGRGLPSGTVSVVLELCIVFDYENSKHFNFDEKKILEYVTPFVNTANNHFQTMKDVKILVQISGVYVFKDLKAQPSKFTEKGADGIVSAWEAFDQFESWAYENVDLPKHDVIVVFYSDDKAKGCWEMSNLKGACQIIPSQKKIKSSIFLRDSGGNMGGAHTFGHQLGHTLGADQDGSVETSTASKCDRMDGYAMAHIGRRTAANSVKFSECSKIQIKEFIQSTGGHCLFQVGNPQPKVSSTQIPLGPNPTKVQQCEFYLGKGAKLQATMEEQEAEMMKRVMEQLKAEMGEEAAKNVVIETPGSGGRSQKKEEKNPDDECKLLVCELKPDKSKFTRQIPVHPAEGTPCGKGGKCQNEKCVMDG